MPTIERFREQVRDSLRGVQQAQRVLEAKQDELDVPALLKLLTNRSKPLGERDQQPFEHCSDSLT